MPVELADWAGAITRPAQHVAKKLISPLARSTDGSSGTFRGLCDDGQEWWIKPVNQLQGGKTIVNDQLLARVGSLIGAPVCSVALVEITSDTAGWEFRDGQRTEKGVAHGSLHVGDPLSEDRSLRSRDRDQNSVRHAGMYALWDWFIGGDDQWLYAGHDDDRIYAHDLGHFLPGANSWTIGQLVASVDEPHMPAWPLAGLDISEVERLADAIDHVTRADLTRVINGLPKTWPVADDELEAVGWFLERRAKPVGVRLRTVASNVTSPAP